MSFLTFYLISVMAAAFGIGFALRYTIKVEKKDVTVSDIWLGLVLVVFPFVNVLVAIGCTFFLYSAFSNKVVFKAKD